MTKIFTICLLSTALAIAGNYEFKSGPCKLKFNTETTMFSYDDSCYMGTSEFRLECTTFSHPKDIKDITIAFIHNQGIKTDAYDFNRIPIDYTASAFASDLENRRISLCRISYKAYPLEIGR